METISIVVSVGSKLSTAWSNRVLNEFLLRLPEIPASRTTPFIRYLLNSRSQKLLPLTRYILSLSLDVVNQKLVKSVLNKHKRRDSWFLTDYSVNAYEGCSCNCLYCYIRGSKYGQNMEKGIIVKSNVLEILERQLQLRA